MSGGGVGGGLGATLGTIAAAALAPETGGASLLVDAGLDATTAAAITGAGLGSVGGALGGAAGAAVSGGNVGSAAESGGIGGFLGGGVSGLLGGSGDAIAGTTGDSLDAGASNVSGATGTGANISGASGTGANISGGSGAGALGDTGSLPTAATGDLSGNVSPSSVGGTGTFPASGGTGTALPSNGAASQPWYQQLNPFSSSSSSAGNNISGAGGAAAAKGNSLSDYLLPAGVGLGLASSLFPQGSNPVNATPINNATTGINTPLPQYNYNSVQTPYTGNWYTYGQRPEGPQITNTVTPVSPQTPIPTAARGGLMRGYAEGGHVRALAIGGAPMQAPMQSPPMMANPQTMQQQPPQGMPQQQATMPRPAGMPVQGTAALPNPNPRQQAARFEIGRRIGNELRKHIMAQGMTPDGTVRGGGKGQDDAIPARLSKDEYVLSADIPSALGDGSSEAGAKVLDKMVANIRAQKTKNGNGFPPKARNPLSYIGGSK